MAKQNNPKITAQHSFEGGMVADLHPMAVPANALYDVLNMEFVTAAGDQYVLQNIKGDKQEGVLPVGYIPLAVKTYKNVAYIVAGEFAEDGSFINGLIGTFPSPVWEDINKFNVSEVAIPDVALFGNFSLAETMSPERDAYVLVDSELPSTKLIPKGDIIRFTCTEPSHQGPHNPDITTITFRKVLQEMVAPGGVKASAACKNSSNPAVTDIAYMPGLLGAAVQSEPTGKSSSVTTYKEKAQALGTLVLPTTLTENVPLTFRVKPGSSPVSNPADSQFKIKGKFGEMTIFLELDSSGYVVEKEYSTTVLRYSNREPLLVEYNITVNDTFYSDVVAEIKSKETTVDLLEIFDPFKLDTYIGSGASYKIVKDTSNTSFYSQLAGILWLAEDYLGNAPSNALIFARAYKLLNENYKRRTLEAFGSVFSIEDVLTTTRTVDTSYSTKLENVFRPLHNFGVHGIDPFISTKFNFKHNAFIDMTIAGSYDGSADLIVTDHRNEVLLINSRFKVNRAGEVKLADRIGEADTNVYSEETWGKVKLLSDDIGIVSVENLEVTDGGKLFGGGYRYYFKYSSQEGNLSDVFYESPFIPISNGALGLNEAQRSSNSILIKLTNIKKGASRVKVFFEHHYGDASNIIKTYEIDKIYLVDSFGHLKVEHTGYETMEPVDSSAINVPLTAIDNAGSLAIVNNRLLIANTQVEYNEEHDKMMASTSLKVRCRVETKLIDGTYSDPNNVIFNLGYWKAEVYEFAVVYVLKRGGVSDAYPIRGIDFDSATLLENDLGVYRAAYSGKIYEIDEPTGTKRPNVTYFVADTSAISAEPAIAEIAVGFFIVRRERLRNAILQGVTSPVIKVATSNRGAGVSKIGAAFYPEMRVSKYFYSAGYYYPQALGMSDGASFQQMDGDMAWLTEPVSKFIPQPTQYLELVDNEGPISAAARPYDDIDTDNFALYSGDLETDAANISDIISGSDGSILTFRNGMSRVPRQASILRNIALPDAAGAKQACTDAYHECREIAQKRFDDAGFAFSGKQGHRRDDYAKCDYNKKRCLERIDDLAANNKGGMSTKILIEAAENVVLGDAIDEFNNVSMQFVVSGTDVAASGMFSGRSDRDLGYMKKVPDSTVVRHNRNYSISVDKQIIQYASVTINNDNPVRYVPSATIYQNYSTYIGLKANVRHIFNFRPGVAKTPGDYVMGALRSFCQVDSISRNWIGNMGDISNLYTTTDGKWGDIQLLDIFGSRDDRAYFAVTDRMPLKTKELDIFRGDGFITRSYKRLTYKAGVGEPSARKTDAAQYGVGIHHGVKYDEESALTDLWPQELDDKGQGLYDIGEIIELISYTNTNADLRSKERFSADDTALAGGDRSFYPEATAAELRADLRPDSTAYNHGYSANMGVLPYMSRGAAPVHLREFPNRVYASNTGDSTQFFNNFRDIRGFSWRDYGADLGPITKIVGLDGMLIIALSDGILAIGVDDRTLMGEGTDVYVDSAQVLSPKPMVLSDKYGCQNPESVVKGNEAIFGLDYSRSIVWMFGGKGVTNISEFTIKTVILGFKNAIESIDGIPRVYSTYSSLKHEVVFSFAVEKADGEQAHVGTLVYSDLLKLWISRRSDGTKFLFDVSGRTYTFGFTEKHAIWEAGVLEKRSIFRGEQAPYWFEIVVNTSPHLDKVLENLVLISNKSLPDEIMYTTSMDNADATDTIWVPMTEDKNRVEVQKISSRGIGGSRLDLIRQNTYYKNSKIYIEVSFDAKMSKNARSKGKKIRDKYISIKIMYSGTDETFIQSVISTLSKSYG